MKNCLSVVGRLILLILAVALVAGLVYYAARWVAGYRPAIYSAQAAAPGGELLLTGARFGKQQGLGRVELVRDSWLSRSGEAGGQPVPAQTTQPLEILTWEDTRILARLPAGAPPGQVQVRQSTPFGERLSARRAFIYPAAGLPSQPYGYTVPTQDDSPWPTFRRDGRNSGRSPLPAVYAGDQPWSFPTGKGIFSTPVIDAQGVIYFGSADHFFYALNPDGSLRWKYETGEIIDSAGALGRYHPQLGSVPITFISGDGFMYHLRTEDVPERLLWKFEADLRPGVSYNRWFEGNVAIGPDETLYAGNTNFNYYAVNPDGTLKWTYATGSNNWSQAAFAQDGSLYWGSLDTFGRAVDPGGMEQWRKMTLGFIAASAAVGSDGTVYLGSFDSSLYALDPATGARRWRFGTGDHIYSSAALGEDAQGNTSAIIFGSADGFLYALDPGGRLLWKFETGDPIRSSPAIGHGPGGSGEIVYFGCGDGRLYALNVADGSLRWAYDTTPADPELRDRNDLNGSPALGETGVYIGGEHGLLVYVPYEYCLQQGDPRCLKKKSQAEPDGVTLRYVTPGGSTLDEFPAELPSSSNLTLRLSVRQNGAPLNARLCNNPLGCPEQALQAQLSPALPFRLEHSADGRYLYLLPQGFFTPGEHYTLTVSGDYYTGGLRLGNLALGGRRAGRFEQQFTFRAAGDPQAELPLAVAAEQVSALEWTRLAAPLPPMLPSLNQIGFDYMDWILGTVELAPETEDGERRFILWALGGRRDAQGVLVADPTTPFLLPLNGRARRNAFILENQSFRLPITGIEIPFNYFQLRGTLGADLAAQPGASAFADTDVLSIPTFGPYLVVAGLANNWYQKLLVNGTYITRQYPAEGAANRRPAGVRVASLEFEPPGEEADGSATATLALGPGAAYPAAEHKAAILLVDEQAQQAVYLDYRLLLSQQADAQGNLGSVTLAIPQGTELPEHLKAYVLLDVFPLYQESLEQ
jgi:outer membrane protein assembly factor BamB